MHRRCLATLALIAATFVGASADGQWPQFRGADAGVAADDPTLPDTWSATDNAIWKTDLPGLGWSSPIVWGDLIFVTSVVSAGAVEVPERGLYFNGERPASTDLHRWMLYAIDFKTGRIRWEREVKRAAPMTGKHVKNTYASETPVTDGERVYAYFASAGLFAFDFSGAPIWSRPLDEMKTRYGWGSAASPVLDGDRVYLVNDNDTQSFIAAFDKRTGAPIWRVERAEGTNWSSPFVWRHDRGAEIVTAGTGRVRSYTLDGVLKWELKGMSSITVPTPFAKHGLLYVISGWPGDSLRPVYAIRPGATGDISLKEGETSNQHIAWFNKTLGSYSTTAVVYGDYFYTLLDRGFLMCNDAKTGQPIYGRQRVAADASGFTASPWAYNGKIFLLSEDGDTFVVQAGPEFKVLRKNSLGEMVMATPAIARGSLIIRTASRLYRIGGAAAKPAVTQIGAIPGPADVVELDGRRAYVGAGSTLRIIDITNPAAPTQMGALTLPQRIWGLAIAGPLVYVANDLNGLVVVDASDPARPTMRGAFKTLGQAVGVAASANKAVIANLMSGVQVVDVTDADKPTSLGSYFTEGYARDVTTSGALAFAIDQPTGFSVLDVSKAGAPTELSAQQSAAQAPIVVAASPAAAGAQGPRVVCVLSNAGAQGTLLQVFDVSNPTSPAKVGSLKTPGRAQRLVVSGDRAFIADGPEGLQVVDVSSPSSPSVVASFKTSGQARDVAASGSTILVVVGGTAPSLSGTAVTNSTSENTSIVILRLEP